MLTDISYETALILVTAEILGGPLAIFGAIIVMGWLCEKAEQVHERLVEARRDQAEHRIIRRSLPGLPGGFVVKI